MIDEKSTLPLSSPQAPAPRRPSRVWKLVQWVSWAFILYQLYATYLRGPAISSFAPRVLEAPDSADGICPQVEEYDPKDALNGLEIKRTSVHKAVQRISEAVQIDTTVGDMWPDPEDDPSPWKVFTPFAEWLEKAFPEVHAQHSPVKREVVHDHGLLYTWKGSDEKLKPLLITAHQDVVPVDGSTLDDWFYPPFSGEIDLKNQTVWGRGALDCKLWLLSSITAVESLLKSGWTPRRTILLSYGFDEEASGNQGAKQLGEHLYKEYGPDSVAMLVDEGTPVMSTSDAESFGAPIAAPAVTEKGSLNVFVEVRSKGGHSSMPPPHTSIGFLSKVLTHLEENPFPDKILEKSKPQIALLQCMRDAPNMPPKLREALLALEYSERSLDAGFLRAKGSALPMREYLFQRYAPRTLKENRLTDARQKVLDQLDFATKSMLKTTQALDLVRGGVKMNALPESANAYINHRIATYSNIAETEQHYKDLLVPLAKELGLSLQAFGEELVPRTDKTLGALVLDRSYWTIDTVDASPFEGKEAGPWRLLSRVIRQTWHLDEPRHELHHGKEQAARSQKYKQPVRVSPYTMFANTDTHWYKRLTSNIFRFGSLSVHTDLTGLPMFHSMHTVNEHASIDAVVKSIDFYTNLIVAVDHEDVNKV